MRAKEQQSLLRLSGQMVRAVWPAAAQAGKAGVEGRKRICFQAQEAARREWSAGAVRSMSTQSSKENKGDDKKDEKSGQAKAGPGFFETFRKSIMDQFSRKTAEDDKVKVAMEQLQQARAEAEEAARKGMEAAQRAADEAKKQADKVGEQTRPTREKIGGAIGEIAKKAVDNPLVRGTAEIGMKAAETILEVPVTIEKKSKEVEEKIAASKMAEKVREVIGSEPDHTGPVAGKPIDGESMGVMIRPESRWERTMRKLKDTAVLGPLVSGTEEAITTLSEASNRLGDRIFETEMSVCMSEIKREEPSFNVHRFLSGLQNNEIPLVLKCTLENKVKDIEYFCTERMIAYFQAEIQARLLKGHTVDSTVMDVDDVELEKAIIWDGEPFLVISFMTQQVHCVKDKDGKVVIGGESELRQIRYRWVMVRVPSEDGKGLPSWKLHEMAKFFETPLIA